jgi:hypothetical protein
MSGIKVSGKKSFTVLALAWVLFWIIFLVRENKPGQYADLAYLYRHNNYEDKVRRIAGKDFYDFLMFCKDAMPEEAVYDISFRAQDIKEAQAIYYLWPCKRVPKYADFKIFYDCEFKEIKGYRLFRKYNDTGFILAKEGRS